MQPSEEPLATLWNGPHLVPGVLAKPCEYKYVGGAWFTGVAATRKQQAKAIVTSLYDDIRPGPDMQQRAAGEPERRRLLFMFCDVCTCALEMYVRPRNPVNPLSQHFLQILLLV